MCRTSTIIGLALCASANAFVSTPRTFQTTQLFSEAPKEAAPTEGEGMDLDLEDMFEMFEDADKKVAGTPVGASMSIALPWAPRPAGLDTFKLAGDRGFDPLGFAKSKEDLVKYRNAEIKHARLAMLAAAGWPISEKLDATFAKALNLPVDLTGDGMAPSLLNGGLGAISPIYWGLVIAAAAAVEVAGLKIGSEIPGDFGFDPLGLYPADPKERSQRQEAEIRHGRIAMVAIVGFAAQEFVDKEPVVKETPFFFEPLWTFLSQEMHFGDLSQGFASY